MTRNGTERNVYYTWLIPYLENALDAEQRRMLEARLAEDPGLAAELESLRRAEPRLRQMAASLRRTEPVAAPGVSVWPRLREQLDAHPVRPRPAPAFWWAGGLCAASALVLAVISFHPWAHPLPHVTRIADNSGGRSAPRVEFPRDNATETQMAKKLRLRAAHVAQARTAAHPRVATALTQVPKPSGVVKTGVSAKRPAAVPPPLQYAATFDSALPAPTHTPSHALKTRLLKPILMADGAGAAKYTVPMPSNPVSTFATPGTAVASPAPARNQMADTNRITARLQSKNSVNVPITMPTTDNTGAVGGGTPNDSARAGEANPAPATVLPERALAGAPAALTINGDTAPLTLRQRLERTVTPPLYGTAEGEQQEQRLLQDAQQAGALDILTAELEHGAITANQAASQEAVAARLRAAIYEMTGDQDRALLERRDVVLLSSATGEDWFELAQTEARLGNADSAGKAYARALRATSPPLSAAHRAIARQHAP